ncbi:unnamed protein product [Diplocarpon coronariae]
MRVQLSGAGQALDGSPPPGRTLSANTAVIGRTSDLLVMNISLSYVYVFALSRCRTLTQQPDPVARWLQPALPYPDYSSLEIYSLGGGELLHLTVSSKLGGQAVSNEVLGSIC